MLSAAYCPASTYTVQDPAKKRHRHRKGHQESSSKACPEPVSLLSLDSVKLTINTSHHKDFTLPLMVWCLATPKQCWGYQYECFHRLWLLPGALLWTWKSVCGEMGWFPRDITSIFCLVSYILSFPPKAFIISLVHCAPSCTPYSFQSLLSSLYSKPASPTDSIVCFILWILNCPPTVFVVRVSVSSAVPTTTSIVYLVLCLLRYTPYGCLVCLFLCILHHTPYIFHSLLTSPYPKTYPWASIAC